MDLKMFHQALLTCVEIPSGTFNAYKQHDKLGALKINKLIILVTKSRWGKFSVWNHIRIKHEHGHRPVDQIKSLPSWWTSYLKTD